jgi:hypothetical protein
VDSGRSRGGRINEKDRKSGWSVLILVVASCLLLALPFTIFFGLPNLSDGLERSILTLWPLIILTSVVAVVLLWRRWLRSNLSHVWIRRSVLAGFVFGACFGNVAFPILGMLIGVITGPIIGLAGGVLVAFLGSYFFQGVDVKTGHRRSQVLGMGVVMLAGLGLLAWFAPHFDDLPSKYVSNGEYIRMYLSMVAWPAILLLAYLGIAGVPSLEHPVLGEGTKARRMTVCVLIAIAFASSLYIGAYWAADNFPHPN